MDMVRLKKLDIVIIAALILLSLASIVITFMASSRKYDNKVVEITVQGKLYKSVPLDKHSENIKVQTSLGENIVEVANGKVRILEASCPDHICIKDGFISKPGQILVCLPNKVAVTIRGKNNSKVDDVAW